MMELGIADRVAFVSGGGMGIGSAICLALAAEGVKVGVNDIDANRAGDTVELIASKGGIAATAVADVTDLGHVTETMRRVDRELGGIDILVNNVGLPYNPVAQREDMLHPTGAGGPLFMEIEPDGRGAPLDLITVGTMNCIGVAAPGMIQRGRGRIVNIASDAGRIGVTGGAVYSMGKGGIIAYTRAMAMELGPHGIGVNCVSPGWVDTESAHQWGMQNEQALRSSWVTPLAPGLKRLGKPEDIADAVLFLVSDRAAWITGQTISVNGGSAML